MSKEYTTDKCFTLFNEDVSNIPFPDRLTFPFCYEPHPLCVAAVNQLQTLLEPQSGSVISEHLKNTPIGKMFGVLVVINADRQLGFLSAFSGKIDEENHINGFVPPIYDLLCKDGFFKIEEENISKINHEITRLENDTDFTFCKNKNRIEALQAESELQNFRSYMKCEKDLRKQRRNEAESVMSAEDFSTISESLKQESLKQQYDYKQLRKQWDIRIENNSKELKIFQDKIKELKEERKTRSAALQRKIFDQYQFLNKDGETTTATEIFAATPLLVPPAGAGDCAAPKLFQFAFQHKMTPIAMAEFWWGASPKSEIRKHAHYYPSCRSKCEPILGYMLSGLPMDENPLLTANEAVELQIIYEDDDIVAVNKPHDFLSVPGKEIEISIQKLLQEKYPEATGPLLVHRLDMSTSGILLAAKNKDVHKALQQQFEERTIKKRYVALLDGIVEGEGGVIDLPLRVDLDDRPRQMVCYDYGKPAKTVYKVLERKDGKTRVHFFPITGRTHQLRVHATHSLGLNTPIVGDDLYGTKSERLCLHAEYLEFTHPTTSKIVRLKVEAEF